MGQVRKYEPNDAELVTQRKNCASHENWGLPGKLLGVVGKQKKEKATSTYILSPS